MTYKLIIKREARKAFASFPVFEQERIDAATLKLLTDLRGDVKKLKKHFPRYRLRVGNYRVLFEVVGETIVVHTMIYRQKGY